jgi:hypothetical protein
MPRTLTPEEQERRAHWGRVHVEADRRPWIRLPNVRNCPRHVVGWITGHSTRPLYDDGTFGRPI